MSVLSIIKVHSENYNNFCLNKVSEEVFPDEFNSESLNSIVADMFETLYNYPSGVGLAANQVGILKKICVIDYKRDGKKPIVCINPEYIPLTDDKVKSREQCISFPGITVTVERYNKVKVLFKDIYGFERNMVTEGFKAFVFQHEIDHLNGKVFLNYEHEITPYDGYSARLSKNAMEVILNE